jgi:putative oxidoreductase
MSHSTDLGLLALRLVIALVFVLHAWNHVFGGGKIAGTARWFAGLGMRPGLLHAWAASAAEFGGGALLAVGLLTPLAAAAIVGTMVVAFVTTHRRNGFFIFRPGEGYEYVLVLAVCGLVIGALGPGTWSVDHALGILGPGWTSLVLTAALGLGGGAAQLAAFWRPERSAVASASEVEVSLH